MINFGNFSVGNVKFGSQQVTKVYYGSDLVWEDPWVEYTFPTENARMQEGSGLGFSATANASDGDSSMIAGTSYFMFDRARLTKATYTAKGSDNGASLRLVFPAVLGLVKIQKITLYGTRQCTRFCICGGKNSTDASKNELSKGDMDIFLNRTDVYNTSDPIQKREFNIASPLNGKGINTIRVFGTKPSDSDTIYLGDVFFTFLVRKSKLATWKAMYNIS